MEPKERIWEGDGRVVCNSFEILAMKDCTEGEVRVGRSILGGSEVGG